MPYPRRWFGAGPRVIDSGPVSINGSYRAIKIAHRRGPKTTRQARQKEGELGFRLSWTDPSGAHIETFNSPRATMLRYIEIASRGYGRVEVHDHSGAKSLTIDDLVQRMIAETREMLSP